MVSEIKPILLDDFCIECKTESEKGFSIECAEYNIDEHGWSRLVCIHLLKVYKEEVR